MPQHGYGIIQDVAGISGGRVHLKAGTLYAALERLTEERLIEVDREAVVDARLRRYYRITGRAPPGSATRSPACASTCVWPPTASGSTGWRPSSGPASPEGVELVEPVGQQAVPGLGQDRLRVELDALDGLLTVA
jgi:Transcriptional regulator PadR-like family